MKPVPRESFIFKQKQSQTWTVTESDFKLCEVNILLPLNKQNASYFEGQEWKMGRRSFHDVAIDQPKRVSL